MKCEFCGTEHDVEIHHIKPTIDGGEDIEENKIHLCFKHHRLIHKLGIYDKKIIEEIKECGIEHYFITEFVWNCLDKYSVKDLDFKTLMNFCNFMLDKVAYSESNHSKSIKIGLEKARAKGKHIGRKQVTKDDIPTVFFEHYPLYKNKTISLSEFSRLCDMSRTTIYKYLKMVEGE